MSRLQRPDFQPHQRLAGLLFPLSYFLSPPGEREAINLRETSEPGVNKSKIVHFRAALFVEARPGAQPFM